MVQELKKSFFFFQFCPSLPPFSFNKKIEDADKIPNVTWQLHFYSSLLHLDVWWDYSSGVLQDAVFPDRIPPRNATVAFLLSLLQIVSKSLEILTSNLPFFIRDRDCCRHYRYWSCLRRQIAASELANSTSPPAQATAKAAAPSSKEVFPTPEKGRRGGGKYLAKSGEETEEEDELTLEDVCLRQIFLPKKV